MTSQYGAHELHAGQARLHARTRMHTPMRLAHARTHTCNTYCFTTATIIRKRASLLRYTYIGCIVDCCVTSFALPLVTRKRNGLNMLAGTILRKLFT